ncbi:MAG: DUF3618 domain-containing protein [Actinomycetes bacterium]
MSRDPSAIEREIEETREELARTVDLIAERLSPKRAAARGATKVRDGIGGVFARETVNGNGQLHAVTGTPTEPREQREIHAVPVPAPVTTTRTLRKDRVAVAVGAAVTVIAVVVVLKRRSAARSVRKRGRRR